MKLQKPLLVIAAVFLAVTRASAQQLRVRSLVRGHKTRVLRPGAPYWARVGQAIYGDAIDDGFGYAVALNAAGTIVAGGAPTTNGFGSVRIFEYESRTRQWAQLGQDVNGDAWSDQFGSQVVLSADGNIMATSAGFHGGGGVESGQVRVFRYSSWNNRWMQIGQSLSGEAAGDRLGRSLALSEDGTILVAGATLNDDNGEDSGHVRIFQYNASTDWWDKLDELRGRVEDDRFGRSVALSASGRIVAVGGHWHDRNGKNSGHVRVYQYDRWSKEFVQLGQDLYGEAARDEFGTAMALSSDGTILAVGAVKNDQGGTNSGQVRVFQYNRSSKQWSQVGQALNGEDANDRFGYLVDISADGSIVAAGTHKDGENMADSNYVLVYEYDSFTNRWNDYGRVPGKSVAISNDGTTLATGLDGSEPGVIRVFRAS